MSVSVQVPQPAVSNRRRRVRQKVHAPAYASFSGASRNEMLDLYEVLDISELGVAVQCPAPMEINQSVDLCLDLAEASGQISVTATVVWSDAAGRVGLGFPPLTDSSAKRMRQWLFLNAMAGAANAASSPPTRAPASQAAIRSNYTDALIAASAVQREAESLGNDLNAVLALIASRSQSLLRASGAAIALAESDPATMLCRASAGQIAPPVGATLQVGSGFSGVCVQSARMLRCDDTATDERVDRESCLALGIRSIIAAPVLRGEKVIGLLEVFSSQPNAFGENDSAVLQRFTETILEAVNRNSPPPGSATPPSSSSVPFSSPSGSVLFAAPPEKKLEKEKPEKKKSEKEKSEKNPATGNYMLSGVRLPRAQLYLLITAAAMIALALGFLLAPWIQEKLQSPARNQEHTVLASSQPPAETSTPAADLQQLRELARHGNPAAENAIGLLYAQGDEKQAIGENENEAVRWFTKAAEDGSVPAQYKLGLLYWGGHGVPKDVNKAYFWAVLARAGGQEGSKDLAKVLSSGMTRAQTSAIEQQAEMWYQQHESHAKPSPAR